MVLCYARSLALLSAESAPSIFPVLLVQRLWVYSAREHTRMRVHIRMCRWTTLAQSSSIARQLAATGASRGSSRSSSKADPLVAQHPPAAANTHAFVLYFLTSLRVISPSSPSPKSHDGSLGLDRLPPR